MGKYDAILKPMIENEGGLITQYKMIFKGICISLASKILLGRPEVKE